MNRNEIEEEWLRLGWEYLCFFFYEIGLGDEFDRVWRADKHQYMSIEALYCDIYGGSYDSRGGEVYILRCLTLNMLLDDNGIK